MTRSNTGATLWFRGLRLILGLSTCTMLALSALARGDVSTIRLDTARALGDGVYELSGEFGVTCRGCEVIVEYRDGLRYAHAPFEYRAQRMRVRLADLNRGEELTVRVRTLSGVTNPRPVRLIPRLVPARVAREPAAVDNLHVFERTYRLAVGDKGEDHFDVSTALPACGEKAGVFHAADIVYRERRFGEAQVVALPPAGCTRCPPLKVRWYYEPTGRLAYQLHITRRVVEGLCPDRRR